MAAASPAAAFPVASEEEVSAAAEPVAVGSVFSAGTSD